MPVCYIATGQSSFEVPDSGFAFFNISYNNFISFVSDRGRQFVFFSCIKGKQPNVFQLGCVCHVAKKLPLSLEDLIIDVYYHLTIILTIQKSSLGTKQGHL